MTISLNTLPKVSGQYLLNAPLKAYSWLGVGGSAECMFIPEDLEDLRNFLYNKPKEVSIFILGAGSNILIRDGGIEGVVIKLGGNFAKIAQINNEPVISVGTAALDMSVANFAFKNAISGLEFLSGIPGSIGGAIAINAGAYGGEISQVLESVDIMKHNSEVITIPAQKLFYAYRSGKIEKDWIFVNAILKGQFGDARVIKKLMEEIKVKRYNSQPITAKTCGSTFKNPKHHKAWHLIETSGCRGLRVGGATMSELHCNFIINDNNATATDIEELIQLVKKRVYKHTSIMLEEEVIIVGKKPNIKEDCEYMYMI